MYQCLYIFWHIQLRFRSKLFRPSLKTFPNSLDPFPSQPLSWNHSLLAFWNPKIHFLYIVRPYWKVYVKGHDFEKNYVLLQCPQFYWIQLIKNRNGKIYCISVNIFDFSSKMRVRKTICWSWNALEILTISASLFC